MSLRTDVRWLVSALVAGAIWLGLTSPAEAIPVFARQTGHHCEACHISYPELTEYGREFKLNGYTFGTAQPIPLAAAIMAQFNTISDNVQHANLPGQPAASNGVNCSGCNSGQIIQYSVFAGGRVTDDFGLFWQMSGNESPFSSGGNTGASGGPQTFAGNPTTAGGFTPISDNTDIRYVHRFNITSSLEPDLVMGLDINNNIMVQDVWMTGPAWRYPNGGGGIAYALQGLGPVTAPYMEGPNGQRLVGLGVYGWWHKSVYAELSFYRAPWGFWSWIDWGQNEQSSPNNAAGPVPGTDILAHYNPYVRLAYDYNWGYNSAHVGFWGLDAKTYQCNPSQDANTPNPGPCPVLANATNKYRDWAFDGQYQYNKGEPWVFTAAASYEVEQNNFSTALAANPGSMSSYGHNIRQFNINGRAYYDRKYGINVGFESISGTADPLLYGNNAALIPAFVASGGTTTAPGVGSSLNGSPTSNFWTFELNYLPLQNLRFTLQYLLNTKINGGGDNYDGLGNNASGQNQLTGAIWWAF